MRKRPLAWVLLLLMLLAVAGLDDEAAHAVVCVLLCFVFVCVWGVDDERRRGGGGGRRRPGVKKGKKVWPMRASKPRLTLPPRLRRGAAADAGGHRSKASRRPSPNEAAGMNLAAADEGVSAAAAPAARLICQQGTAAARHQTAGNPPRRSVGRHNMTPERATRQPRPPRSRGLHFSFFPTHAREKTFFELTVLFSGVLMNARSGSERKNVP